jgi:hypothetical protein
MSLAYDTALASLNASALPYTIHEHIVSQTVTAGND